MSETIEPHFYSCEPIPVQDMWKWKCKKKVDNKWVNIEEVDVIRLTPRTRRSDAVQMLKTGNITFTGICKIESSVIPTDKVLKCEIY